MTAQEFLRAGQLREAIQAITAEVRDHPADHRRRTFLFELLCFAGDFERAQKHLNLLARESKDAETGALLYRSAIVADFMRQQLFEVNSGADIPTSPAAAPRPGTLNGRPFQTIEDADPRIGARLEIFVAGEYLLLPFEAIGALRLEPPSKLRDLLWSSAQVIASPSYKDREFGEVLLPVLYPHSSRHADDNVKLGRLTEWQELPDGRQIPVGQRLLLLDGGEEEIPLLEVRELQFTMAEEAPDTAASSAD